MDYHSKVTNYFVKVRFFILMCLLSVVGFGEILAETVSRWQIMPDGSQKWVPGETALPHNDDIEMSGQMLSGVVRYGVESDSSLTLERSIIWPTLRFQPNLTRNHLIRRFAVNIPDLIMANNRAMGPEKVDSVKLEGILKIYSSFPHHGLRLSRVIFPSRTLPVFVESYSLENADSVPVDIEMPNLNVSYTTDASQGVSGEYRYGTRCTAKGFYRLNPGDKLDFYVDFYACKLADEIPVYDHQKELSERLCYLDELKHKLILDVPDATINRMHAFAKIRASESIYKTKCGLLHGPGGESYYAAIWANDQAEYVNPFFPYLGYEIGNESALNSFRQFASYMNDDYKAIPSSIISEGDGYWHNKGDRGDCAMIAYGASRYALARGDKKEAEELWPLIEWCLEYCRRNLTEDGVVASDTDELENRFPAGKANLCTSSLYYDALISAYHLANDLGKTNSAQYKKQAIQMRQAIANYFEANVEGYNTYRYYDGNDILRSWICIPLTMGIYDRAEGTIDALFSPRLWTDDGLLTQAGTTTFWDRTTLYALRGAFAAGASDKGLEYLKKYSYRRLLGDRVPYAIEAWPEGSQRHLSAESGLYCRIFTEGLFGMRPTGLKSFDLRPQLPLEWNYMNLRSVRAHGHDFDVLVVRVGNRLEVKVEECGKTIIKRRIRPGDTIKVKF